MSDLLDRVSSALSSLYSVQRELGRGGMATVFLATDRKHDRPVAIKVLHPELSAAIGSDRFLREINIEAHLRHPHIVPLLDSGSANDLLYYVMPFVEGESLRQRLVRQGRLDIAEALRYWRDVVDAIAHAHRQGIVHRDIKPENVLVAERHASVVDFGVGKALGDANTHETLTKLGMVVGTPTYMAPEQAMVDAESDHRVDIYALGILAYEMLTGKPPFATLTPAAQFAAKATAPAPNVREERPEIGVELAEQIRRCLEPQPGRRWQTADELLVALESITTPATGSTRPPWSQVVRPSRRRNAILATVALGAVFVTGATYAVSSGRERRWAKGPGLAELRRHAATAIIATSNSDSAFLLAQRLRAIIPADSETNAILNRVSMKADLHTAPEGARVSWTAYRGDTASWHEIGVTPLKEAVVPAPRPGVVLLIKYEKPGYRTAVRPLAGDSVPAVLDSVSSPDSGMVRVRGASATLADPKNIRGETVRYPDFFIDRLEVTNREFKKFVAAGGYQRKELWEPFRTTDGVERPWAEVVRAFVDKTGRAGPATWLAGDIPTGKEDFPVGGISWYEARAYARFVGKELPSIHQWRRAAQIGAGSWIVTKSNVEKPEVAAVGAFTGMSPFGAVDMAGNVRDWCANADGDSRYVLGGSWAEAGYSFGETRAADAYDRSESNGMRLVRLLPDANGNVAFWDRLSGPIPRSFRDYAREKPVSDAEFRSFLPNFDYDKSPLNAKILTTDSSDSRWIRQIIEFDAAYGQERMKAFLFLPRVTTPPYQTVVYYPGSGAIDATRNSTVALTTIPDYVVTAGRALLYPVYMDTYERKLQSAPMTVDPVYNMSGGLLGPNTYRDHVVMDVKDLRRSLDYLATRADIDTAKFGYLGTSWGGRLGAINLSVERRFKVAALHLPGLMFAPRLPVVDELNYLPRVTLPTLMLSGRYDNTFPFETAAMPFVRMLGVPAAQKKHIVYPTHHFLPRENMIRETLDWFDQHLGKVAPARP